MKSKNVMIFNVDIIDGQTEAAHVGNILIEICCRPVPVFSVEKIKT